MMTEWDEGPEVDQLYTQTRKLHHISIDIVDEALTDAKSLPELLLNLEIELDDIEEEVEDFRALIKQIREATG